MVNVLILEDDPIIALDIKSIVETLPRFHAFIASDTPSAMKIAHKYRLHVVLADIQIKGSIDGIETAQMLQQLYHSHVIFLTSFSDEETLKRASSISITGYILKPFREEELIASLRLCALRIQETSAFIDIGKGYVYSIKHQQLYLNDVPVILAAKEQQLFLLLLHNRGKIVPLSYIDEVIWSDSVISDTARRQLMHRLRTKLPELSFEVVKYSGYKLND